MRWSAQCCCERVRFSRFVRASHGRRKQDIRRHQLRLSSAVATAVSALSRVLPAACDSAQRKRVARRPYAKAVHTRQSCGGVCVHENQAVLANVSSAKTPGDCCAACAGTPGCKQWNFDHRAFQSGRIGCVLKVRSSKLTVAFSQPSSILMKYRVVGEGC